MKEFIKKYRNYLIIASVILLVAGVFVVKQITTKKSENNNNRDYTFRMYNFEMVGCSACRVVKPTYDKIKDKYKNEIEFKDIDINREPALADKYNIMYTPTFVLTDIDGNILTGFVGVATEEEFDKYIDIARSKINGSNK